MLKKIHRIDKPPEDKFIRVYNTYRKLMYSIAYSILQNQQDAEDAVHQAFVSIIENLDKLRDVGSDKTRAYIAVTTRRKALDIVRYRARISSDIEEMSEQTAITMEFDTENRLALAMGRLPERYRQVLLLKFDIGYSTKELSKLLGMSEDSVQKLIWRAKDRLKVLLEEVDNE